MFDHNVALIASFRAYITVVMTCVTLSIGFPSSVLGAIRGSDWRCTEVTDLLPYRQIQIYMHRCRYRYASRNVDGEDNSNLLYISYPRDKQLHKLYVSFKSLEQIIYLQIKYNSRLLSIIKLIYLLVAGLQCYDNFLFLPSE